MNHPTNLMVGVGGVGTEYFRLVGVHFLLVALSVSHFGRLSGQGVSCVFCGITPSFFWLAKIVSRSSFQPFVEQMHSLIFSTHSFVG